MFRSPFNAGGGNSDPHNIHEKILQAAKRSGVISLNGRGLSYGNTDFISRNLAFFVFLFLLCLERCLLSAKNPPLHLNFYQYVRLKMH